MSNLQDNLLAHPTTVDTNGWVRRHNEAVTDFFKDRMGAANSLTRDERAILSLIYGLDQFIGSSACAGDHYVVTNVVGPGLQAIGSALDMSMGRLDGGTLSGWVRSTADRVGLDPDTMEFVGV